MKQEDRRFGEKSGKRHTAKDHNKVEKYRPDYRRMKLEDLVKEDSLDYSLDE